MTTPRDAIGLSERLRFDAARCELHFSKGVASNIEEAATALDALQARVKELEAEQAAIVRDYQRMNSQLADEMKHATRAEQERDEAYERAAKEAENFDHADTWPGCDSDHDLSNVARVIGGETCDAIAAAIRRLAEFKEEK